jgi:hypothetical protein
MPCQQHNGTHMYKNTCSFVCVSVYECMYVRTYVMCVWTDTGPTNLTKTQTVTTLPRVQVWSDRLTASEYEELPLCSVQASVKQLANKEATWRQLLRSTKSLEMMRYRVTDQKTQIVKLENNLTQTQNQRLAVEDEMLQLKATLMNMKADLCHRYAASASARITLNVCLSVCPCSSPAAALTRKHDMLFPQGPHILTYMPTYLPTYLYIYIYIHTHTHKYTYTKTQIYTCTCIRESMPTNTRLPRAPPQTDARGLLPTQG